MNSSLPQFESSYLTPARLQWVMDVGETTVAEWIKNRELEYFKKGRLIRFAPDQVLAFINRYTVRGRGVGTRPLSSGAPGGPPPGVEESSPAWGRIERLILDQVNAALANLAVGHKEAA